MTEKPKKDNDYIPPYDTRTRERVIRRANRRNHPELPHFLVVEASAGTPLSFSEANILSPELVEKYEYLRRRMANYTGEKNRFFCDL